MEHEKKILNENLDDSRSESTDGTLSRQMVNDMEACVLLLNDKVAAVCVFKNMYMYVRICACVYVCMYIYTYIYIHIYIYIYIYMYIHIYLYIYVYVHIYAYKVGVVCPCTCFFQVSICMRVCVHAV